MPRIPNLDSLKTLLRSSSGRKYRCDWCQEQFEYYAELSEHFKGTERKNLEEAQKCLPIYRCDWCDGRFDTLSGLSEHIRGTTRSSSTTGPICVPDPLDTPGSSSQIGDKYSEKPPNEDHITKETVVPVQGLDNVTDNAALPISYCYETTGEEKVETNELAEVTTTDLSTSKSNSISPETPMKIKSIASSKVMISTPWIGPLSVENPTLLQTKEQGDLHNSDSPDHKSLTPDHPPDMFYHPGMSANRPLPPLPAPSKGNQYEYWRQYPSIRGPVFTPTQIGFSTSNSRTSAYGLPGRLDTNASTQSYVTARTSSYASYRTAPSFKKQAIPSLSGRLDTVLDIDSEFMNLLLPPLPEGRPDLFASGSRSRLDFEAKTVYELEQQVITEACLHLDVTVDIWDREDFAAIISRRTAGLAKSNNVSLASLASTIEETVTEICDAIKSIVKQPSREEKLRSAVARHTLDYVAHLCDLKYLTVQLERYFCKISSGFLGEKERQVFSSEWLEHLRSRGILLDSLHELNWSGRGQHVEYQPKDENEIPLRAEEILGHSATAIVESVRCRRIKLARKRIRCNGRILKEVVIAEVEHLNRLQHAHILRIVGTYTLKKDLAILLYPATPWNLEEFMDELLDTQSIVNKDVLDTGSWRMRAGTCALRSFFGCLSNALDAIHKMNIKHMDIKPKNLLVRPFRKGSQLFKVYVADFGIARAYKSADESETDSPISFTRTYAAPEVVLQDPRGFSADVFSLGCVFMEMLATIASKPGHNVRQKLLNVRKSSPADPSFQANLAAVQSWYQGTFLAETPTDQGDTFLPRYLLDVVPKMVQSSPHDRPSSIMLESILNGLSCQSCYEGPEPFEAADASAD
jgi:serine/threonine protein kinase